MLLPARAPVNFEGSHKGWVRDSGFVAILKPRALEPLDRGARSAEQLSFDFSGLYGPRYNACMMGSERSHVGLESPRRQSPKTLGDVAACCEEGLPRVWRDARVAGSLVAC